jgi:WD40 repeat protein
VDYSPDGTRIAVGGMSDGTVNIYDAKTFNLNFTIPKIAGTPTPIVSALKFSRDNLLLGIGYNNGLEMVYNLFNYTSFTVGGGNQTYIYSLDFSNDSSLLAFCGKSATLKVYNFNANSIVNNTNLTYTGITAN